jgi:NAD-dependent deacetylase
MNRIVFFSGAGISADSGIPTYRDADGIWKKYDPDKVCNYHRFFDDHQNSLNFYNEMRTAYNAAEPNAAHIAVAKLQDKYGPETVKVFTQNVDTLFEKAGCSDVVHIHGIMDEMQCLSCDETWKIDPTHILSTYDLCPECGSEVIKPGIVMFGEQAPHYSTLITFCYNLDDSDIVVIIGTSFDVVPMKYVIGQTKTQKHPYKILCNLTPSRNIKESRFDEVHYGRASECIDQIIDKIEQLKKG